MATESRSLLERISSRLAPKDGKTKQINGFHAADMRSPPEYDGEDSPVLPQCTQELYWSDSDTEITPMAEHIRKLDNVNFKLPQEKPRSNPVILESSDDEDFENFLVQLQTPKQRTNKVSNSQNGSIKEFIVDSGEEDFDSVFPRNKKGAKSKAGAKNSREEPFLVPPTNPSSTSVFSPVFISDSDGEDSVVIKSTWRDRNTGRGIPKSDRKPKPGGESLPKTNKENSADRPSGLPLRGDLGGKSEMRIPTLYSSGSSDDEFESLVERIKNRIKTPTPSSTARKGAPQRTAVTEPSKVPKVPCFDLTNRKETGKGRKPKSEVGVSSSPYFPPEKDDNSIEKPRSHSVKSVCKVPDCFLQDLSLPTSPYVKNFKQKKEELTARLYTLYNHTIFDLKLPENMEILWNKKMRKTAGYCVTGQKKLPFLERYARIELSEKVCDSADRLRDTLIHEICHAATWLINGVRDGHGQFWRFYAKKATVIHPELPMVTRCHSYEINYKFTYECSRCKNKLGRHSKSLDTEKFVCALCKGKLVLLGSTRKDGSPAGSQLTPFAKFVKENYGSAKKGMTGMSHAEVMRKLSADFSTKARITNGI
ncbi:germ cell nuclear acidic protein [Pelodytes ibericus]